MPIILLILFIFSVSCSHSKVAVLDTPPLVKISDEKLKVTCSQKSDVRYLEIRQFQNSGCSLIYTKFNTEKSIASAISEKKYCHDVSNKIIQNLTDSGFSCE